MDFKGMSTLSQLESNHLFVFYNLNIQCTYLIQHCKNQHIQFVKVYSGTSLVLEGALYWKNFNYLGEDTEAFCQLNHSILYMAPSDHWSVPSISSEVLNLLLTFGSQIFLQIAIDFKVHALSYLSKFQ